MQTDTQFQKQSSALHFSANEHLFKLKTQHTSPIKLINYFENQIIYLYI